MLKIPIPKHWTADEALTIFLFLDDIRESISSTYGPELLQAYKDYCHDAGVEDRDTLSKFRTSMPI